MAKAIIVGQRYCNRESLNVWRVVDIIGEFAIVEREQYPGRMFRWSVESLGLPVYSLIA